MDHKMAIVGKIKKIYNMDNIDNNKGYNNIWAKGTQINKAIIKQLIKHHGLYNSVNPWSGIYTGLIEQK